MQRVVFLRMEYRDNKAFPIKTLERLAVIDDQGDPSILSDLLEQWASDTAKAMATTISMTKRDLKELRQSAVKNLIS